MKATSMAFVRCAAEHHNAATRDADPLGAFTNKSAAQAMPVDGAKDRRVCRRYFAGASERQSCIIRAAACLTR
jgi:hypothetical protein